MTVMSFKPVLEERANKTRHMIRPAVNVMNDGEAYTIQMAVPGYDREAIHVELNKGILSVHAEALKVEGKFARKEFTLGAFKRQFQLPKDVDSKAISANQENGILSIRLPKMEAAKPRSIQVA